MTADEVNISIPQQVNVAAGSKQNVTVNISLTEQGKSNLAKAFSNGGYPVDFKLEKMVRVATVAFTFEKDSALTYLNLSGKSGFTPLGVKWNGNTGTAALSYLQNGAGGSLTKDALCDIARVEFETAKTTGTAGIRLTGVSVSGYDENNNAIYFTTEIAKNNVSVSVIDKNKYDLNEDGVVDLLDITYCQKFYCQTSGMTGWNKAAHCDLDNNGVIDV